MNVLKFMFLWVLVFVALCGTICMCREGNISSGWAVYSAILSFLVSFIYMLASEE